MITQADRRRAEVLVCGLLEALAIDLDEEAQLNTPRRFVQALLEFYNPDCDPGLLLSTSFKTERSPEGAMVIQKAIPFRGLCCHHLMPFFGTAAIGYIPRKRYVGLSKLTRLVEAVGTMKPSTQEDITNTIADTMASVLEPLGVMVVTSATHTCMTVRGANAPGVVTTVSSIRGLFRDGQAARAEFLSCIS